MGRQMDPQSSWAEGLALINPKPESFRALGSRVPNVITLQLEGGL